MSPSCACAEGPAEFGGLVGYGTQPRVRRADAGRRQADRLLFREGPRTARSPDPAGTSEPRRKRHLLVDTLGLLLGVAVTPGSCPERAGGKTVLDRVAGWLPRWRRLWVDGGYSGEDFSGWVREQWHRLKVEVVKRSDNVGGLVVLPRRWVVERTFGWLMRHRRLVRDYERTEASAEAWIHLAMIRVQIRRLA